MSLTSFGSTTNPHDASPPGFAGRKSLAVNRDLDSVGVILSTARQEISAFFALTFGFN
jgi:hypothetical protein